MGSLDFSGVVLWLCCFDFVMLLGCVVIEVVLVLVLVVEFLC